MTEVEARVKQKAPRVSPADRMVSELAGKYYKLTEAAEILGVSDTTLRRLMRDESKGLDAPSFQVSQGEMVVYLYTKADLKELREYFKSARQPVRRKGRKKGK